MVILVGLLLIVYEGLVFFDVVCFIVVKLVKCVILRKFLREGCSFFFLRVLILLLMIVLGLIFWGWLLVKWSEVILGL